MLKNKGLGTYLFVKIMAEMKQEIDFNLFTRTTFHLSEAQATSSSDTLLRNLFYKNLGCDPSNGDWGSLKDGSAIVNFDNMRDDWNQKKVQEYSMNELLMYMLDIHRQSSEEATKYKNKLTWFNEYYLPKSKKWDHLVSGSKLVIAGLIIGLTLYLGVSQ